MTSHQQQAGLSALNGVKPWFSLGSALCFFALTALTHTSVLAQTLYRSVGPDGRVTFSDQPPATQAKVTTLSAEGRDASAANAALPYELRQVASKYPVTLYTSKECAPCDEGRTLLRSRGVPFTEKTITSNEDTESLKRIADTTSLPLLTVGSQQIKGYSAAEWTQYLTAAGYPTTSKLPASYHNAAPTPLVAVKAAAVPTAPAKADTPTRQAPSTVAPRTNPDNPAGIQF